MPTSNYQIEHIIRESSEAVAEQGRAADPTDLMLACFGYLAHEIQKPQWWSVKRVVPIAFGGGGLFTIGIVGVILKWFSG